MNWENITKLVLICAIASLIGYDTIVMWGGSDNATISSIVYNFACRYPVSAFAAGLLCGHLFWPQRSAT